jgi:RNA polymerase sigma-70 factor (ECF subfamily)
MLIVTSSLSNLRLMHVPERPSPREGVLSRTFVPLQSMHVGYAKRMAPSAVSNHGANLSRLVKVTSLFARDRLVMCDRRPISIASDVDLLSRSARGDRLAFDEIVVRHGPFALRVVARLLGNTSVAEDLVQESFLRAWSRAADFDPSRARFTTWLYRIVVNLCIDYRRQRRPIPLPYDYDPVDGIIGADESVDGEARHAAVTKAICSLPLRQRAALSLVYDEDMTGAEAARILGSSPKAVERLLARARASLRKQLGRD